MRSRTDSSERDGSRAQSEVVSFVLVFSIILVAISVVSVFGVTALEAVKDATTADNGELAMQSVDASMEELYYGTSVSKTSEFSLDSATLETGAEVEMTVQGSSWTFRPIVYRSEAADIVYENSMVVREQDDGAVAVTESLFDVTSDRAIIPVIRTTSADVQSVGGGTHQLVARTTGTEREIQTNPSGGTFPVVLALEWDNPGRLEVWQRTLNEEIGTAGLRSPPCQEDPAVDDRLVCEFETETLVVSVVEIEYGME